MNALVGSPEDTAQLGWRRTQTWNWRTEEMAQAQSMAALIYRGLEFRSQHPTVAHNHQFQGI